MNPSARIAALIAVAGCFYLAALLGTATRFDGALVLVAAVALLPSLRPQLLILAASVQDAPGYAYPYSYAGFLGVASAVLWDRLARPAGVAGPSANRARSLAILVVGAVLLLAYGVVVSLMQDRLGHFPQAEGRNYFGVAALSLVMLLAGVAAAEGISLQPEGDRLTRAVVAVCILHLLLIAAVQVIRGPEFYRSPGAVDLVLVSSQLTEATVIGVPRIASAFLSPNAFTIAVFLLLVCLVRLSPRRWRGFLSAGYLVAGGASSVLSLSRSMLAFFLGSSVFVVSRRSALILGTTLIGLGLLALAKVPDLLELAGELFRLQGGGLGYRGEAWTATVAAFSFEDWITGTGLAAWPVFLGHRIGVPLADPHSWLLSVPGTFGLPGLLYYALVFVVMFRALQAAGDDRGLRVALSLLMLLIFVRDLVAMPVLLGNTPIAFLVWLSLALCMAANPVDRRVGHQLPER